MNRKLLRLQLFISGTLGLILAAEWGYGEYAQSQLRDALDKPSESNYQADDLPALSMPRQTAESFPAIVERPLFIEGRKPLPETAQVDPQQMGDNQQIDDWALIGIYNKEKDKRPMALFSNKNEAKKYLKISEEQMVSGWQLKEIQSDRVVLEQGGQQKSVMLRKPRPQIKSPPAPHRPPVPAKPGQPGQPANQANPGNPAVPMNNNPPENTDDDS